MKKYFKSIALLILLLFSTAYLSNAQDTGLTKHYIGVFLLGGSHSIRTEKSIISLSYVDESPSRDFLYTTKNIEDGSRGTGISLGLEGGKYKGGHFELGFGAMFGKASRLFTDIGGGYNISLGKRFIIRPVAAISLGAARFAMGDIVNNSVYIQVNGTKFFDTKVSTSLRQYQVGFKPRIDFLYRITNKINARVNVGYYLKIYNTDPYLHFSGSHPDETTKTSSISAKENVSEANVDLRINGETNNKELPVKFDGLFINLGISYSFSR